MEPPQTPSMWSHHLRYDSQSPLSSSLTALATSMEESPESNLEYRFQASARSILSLSSHKRRFPFQPHFIRPDDEQWESGEGLKYGG